jgi:hypothetical protein
MGKPLVRSLADDGLDDHDRKLLSDVDRVGWHLVMIPEEDEAPGWAFSVGLFKSFGHPEVVVFGLPLELGGRVVNGIGAHIKAGSVFAAESEYPGILEGVLCTFRPVDRRWYRPFIGYATWYYRDGDFPVLQCLWPDKQQRYPWDAGFKPAWLWAQPLLYETESGPARAERLLALMGGE